MPIDYSKFDQLADELSDSEKDEAPPPVKMKKVGIEELKKLKLRDKKKKKKKKEEAARENWKPDDLYETYPVAEKSKVKKAPKQLKERPPLKYGDRVRLKDVPSSWKKLEDGMTGMVVEHFPNARIKIQLDESKKKYTVDAKYIEVVKEIRKPKKKNLRKTYEKFDKIAADQSQSDDDIVKVDVTNMSMPPGWVPKKEANQIDLSKKFKKSDGTCSVMRTMKKVKKRLVKTPPIFYVFINKKGVYYKFEVKIRTKKDEANAKK